MSMYETRDAALNWANEYSSTLQADGYRRGRANPCLFWHPSKKAAVMIHGDDFISVGNEGRLKNTRKTVEEKYKLKQVQVLGPGQAYVQEICVLNKILR